MRIVFEGRVGRWKRGIRIAVASSMLFSCASIQCERDGQDTIEFKGGSTNASGTVYESARVDGEYLHFPRGREYALHHGLQGVPNSFKAFLSFTPEPLLGSGFTESAGNQVVYEEVSDEIVIVRNDTCAEFYLRVELRADSIGTEVPPDAG